jgi:hypothetical protein
MTISSVRVGVAIGLAFFAIGFALLSASPIALSRSIEPGPSSAVTNLLINPDFEDGYSYPLPCCNNIAVPAGWNIRWYTDTAIVIKNVTYTFKQPEVKIIDNTQWPFCDDCAPNIPPRVHSGRYAVDSFVLFAPQDTTVYQQVGHIPLGAVVTGMAWLHTWASSCNPFPQNATIQLPAISLQGPNDAANGYRCVDDVWPSETTHMLVGIDPFGGTDPRAASVVWNWDEDNPAWWGPYDHYSPTLPVTATAQAYTVTLFLRGVTRQPVRYDDLYFDSASLAYRFPLQWQIDQARGWPLSTAITIGLQAPVSLTQVGVDLQDPIGNSVPIDPLGSSATAPFTLSWRFIPAREGSHRFTLTAHELPDPLVKTIEVNTLPFAYQQDHLLSPGDSTWVTYTLSSPVTLTNLTSAVSDSSGVAPVAALVSASLADGAYRFAWRFTAQASSWYTVTFNADEFIQPYVRRMLVLASQIYLPVVLRAF